MIGVICREDERKYASEFFELFKTPWEFFDSNKYYDVIVSTLPESPTPDALLVIVYSSTCTGTDRWNGLERSSVSLPGSVRYRDITFPIYGNLASFHGGQRSIAFHQSISEPVAVVLSQSEAVTIRVGYDLFDEIAHLLVEGQPAENALVPTLDYHISFLRDQILNTGIPLVEIPPFPSGYACFGCLTHDIDFAGIRHHRLDSTFWGFVYRASIGSLMEFLRRRLPVSHVIKNLMAVIKLPLVFAGLLDDPWERFDRYVDIEGEARSTFFLIPIKNHPGMDHPDHGNARRRSAPYEPADIQEQIEHLLKNGCEIAVHGIDAWCSAENALFEMKKIHLATGQSVAGVRMHWLYYDHRSPLLLEEAGFKYDATLGYNEAVGFRNGTTQVFKPVEATHLLELPLNIQDTALFYPRRMNLTDKEAARLCSGLLETVQRMGGVLTLSWHDRSLEPERLWGDIYRSLLQELGARKAWVGNACQITEWFRRRRSASFQQCRFVDGSYEINLSGDAGDDDPRLLIRLYIPSQLVDPLNGNPGTNIIDTPWNGEHSLRIDMGEKETA